MPRCPKPMRRRRANTASTGYRRYRHDTGRADPRSDIDLAVVLGGRWGRLRPVDAEQDASRLYPLSHDEHTHATWVDMEVRPFANEEAFAEHFAELLADKKRAFFAVAGLDDQPQGWLWLMEASPAHHVVELGYVLYTPPLQQTRLAAEALYLIMRHVFDDLGYRRLEWPCTSTNHRSRKAADRLGFVYEGTHRQGLFLKGKPCDICMYSMFSRGWPTHHATFQTWLEPGKFPRWAADLFTLRNPLGFRL